MEAEHKGAAQLIKRTTPELVCDLATHDALREARKVFHISCGCQLAACGDAVGQPTLKEDRLQFCTRRVYRRCVCGRPGADDAQACAKLLHHVRRGRRKAPAQPAYAKRCCMRQHARLSTTMSHFCNQAMFERPSVLEEGYDRLLGCMACFSRSDTVRPSLTAFSRPLALGQPPVLSITAQLSRAVVGQSQRCNLLHCFGTHTCLPAYRSHPARQHGPRACKPTVPKVHQTTLLQLLGRLTGLADQGCHQLARLRVHASLRVSSAAGSPARDTLTLALGLRGVVLRPRALHRRGRLRRREHSPSAPSPNPGSRSAGSSSAAARPPPARAAPAA